MTLRSAVFAAIHYINDHQLSRLSDYGQVPEYKNDERNLWSFDTTVFGALDRLHSHAEHGGFDRAGGYNDWFTKHQIGGGIQIGQSSPSDWIEVAANFIEQHAPEHDRSGAAAIAKNLREGIIPVRSSDETNGLTCKAVEDLAIQAARTSAISKETGN
ncbi:MAG: hypothetical protein J0L97_00635 [Alphaproteobacteria bacterium]|nr:hypothetical protein [Alphaproteobacteria bacterium]